MSDAAVKTHANFVLPPSIITRIDVARLVSEVERVDGEMTSVTVRNKIGETQEFVPVMSEQLMTFLVENTLTLVESQERSRIIKELRLLKNKVPVIHVTFAVTADPESLAQLAAWVRSSIHPQAVIAVGLQPQLVAGVYLRTPNHVHDLSLRAKMAQSRGVMVEALEAYRAG
jgi:F0F1-type ATP synthase delta subunit